MKKTKIFPIGAAITLSCIAAFLHHALNVRHRGHRVSPEEHMEQFLSIAEQLGMNEDALRIELDTGKSIADIAKEREIELDTPPLWMRRVDKDNFLKNIAEKIGISEEELRIQIKQGKRLLDIAEENGVDLSAMHSLRSLSQ